MALADRGERREEAEGDEGHPVARDGREVLPRRHEDDGRDEEARGEIPAERSHVRIRELHRPLDRDHRRREEKRGHERAAQPTIGDEHRQRLPPGDVRSLDVEQIHAAHADQDAGDAEETWSLLERDIAQDHQEQEAHLPQRGHHGDRRELEGLRQCHGRDDLAHREEQACPHEAGLDLRGAVPENEERGERKEEGEAAPHRHVLVQLVPQPLHHRVAQHLAEGRGQRQGHPHAAESTRAPRETSQD